MLEIRVLVWASSLLVAALVGRFVYRLIQVRSFCRNLPGPPHHPIWGHLQVMGEISAALPPNMHPQAYYTIIAQKYGLKDLYYLDLWPAVPPQCIILDPKLADDFANIPDQHRFSAEFMNNTIGDKVIAVVNGPLWKALHNALSPAVSWSHIRTLSATIVDECARFRTNLDRLAVSDQVFSFEQLVANLIFDITGRIVFAVDLKAQTVGSQELRDSHEMVKLAEAGMDTLQKLNPVAQVKLFLRRRTVLGRLNATMDRNIRERYRLLQRDQVVPSKKNPYSMLDLMLRDKLQDGTRVSGSELTPEEMEVLLHNAKGLLVGGHGTTTDTLSFAFMLLSKAPDIVERLRREHEQLFGQDYDAAADLIVNDPIKLQDARLTEAVIKETLRLFPVGFGPKSAPPGATIAVPPSHDSKDPKTMTYPLDNDIMIVALAHSMHYNPAYFDQPDKFTPDRWLDPHNPIPRSFFRAFGHGPRACLGQNLAVNEMKIVMILTVRYYDFVCADLKLNPKPKASYTALDTVFGDIVFQELGIEAKPRGGMMMRVKKTDV